MYDQMRWCLSCGATGLMMAATIIPGQAYAADRPAAGVPIKLWDAAAPMALGTEPADIPTLTPYYPATPTPTGTSIVVIPGGSYRSLSMDHEGKLIAERLNTMGITAYVLAYRVGPRYHHPVMLTDAQRAIRYARTLAQASAPDSQQGLPQLGLRADRVGIMGFSAGGHLASTAGTHLEESKADAADPIDRVSARPDFLILCYPVITLVEPYAHKVSRGNVLGPTPEPGLAELLSNERQVTAHTPPTFLFHTDEDKGVPPENSVAFYLALRRAGVPAELHIYQRGGHGVGLATRDPVVSSWTERLEGWLRERGLLPGGEMLPKP